MKKIVVWCAVILLLLGLIAYASVDYFARRAIEKGGEQALGVKTELNHINISLWSGQCTLGGFKIFNPQGYASPYFMRLEHGEIAVSLNSLSSDRIRAPRLLLEGLELNLESNNLATNYGAITAYLEKRKEEKLTGKEEESSGKRFVIEEIIIRDIKVHGAVGVWGSPQAGATFTIPEIRLTNIGSGTGSGVLLPQMIRIIVLTVLQVVTETGGEFLPSSILKHLGSALEKVEDVGLYGIQFIGSQVKKGAEGAYEGIKGLFGGDDEAEEKKDQEN